MKKFVIDSRQRESVHRQVDIQEKNRWMDAYRDIPGSQAYLDGIYTGVNNGYADCIHDIKKYLKSLVDEKPEIKLSNVIDLIVFEK